MGKIKSYFKEYYAFLILLIAGIVLVILFFNVKHNIEKIYASFINNTIEKTTIQLQNFFQPVSRDLLISKEMGENGLFNNSSTEKLNKLFIPYLKNSEQLSSMHIANTVGDEYMLLHQDNIWVNRITKLGSKNQNPEWNKWIYRRDIHDSLIEKTSPEKKYTPLDKIWFSKALKSKSEIFPVWTEPYHFITTNEIGVTASIKFKDTQDTSLTNVISFDVLLEDISDFTRNLAVLEHGKTFVITENGEVLGLPNDSKFSNRDSCNAYTLKYITDIGVQEVTDFVNAWKLNADKDAILKFKSNSRPWRGSLQPFLLTPNHKLYIGVIVPEDVIQNNFSKIQGVIIACFFIIVIFTVLVYFTFRRNAKNLVLLQIEKNNNIQKNEELNKALKEKNILLKETYHRVKNNLQIISSLLNLQSNFVNDEEAREAFQKSRRRIESMALVHQKLYNANDLNQIDLGDYIEQLVKSISDSFEGNNVNFNYQINSAKVLAELDVVINLGLIINELVSNSLKYAFSDKNDSAEISIMLNKLSDRKFELIVADNGKGLPNDFDISIPKGLGFEIITALIGQLNGYYQIENKNGLSFKIHFSI
ncbi:MAG: histidine kinase dimerization/phosphoacceptor domain -containing protein [Bacteroidota bacterium]